MKRKFLLAIASLFCATMFISNTTAGNKTEKNPLIIQTTPELKSLSTILAREYQKENPQQPVRVEELQLANLKSNLGNSQNFSLVLESDLSESLSPNLWKIPVGRNVIVALISPSNPFLEEIENTGIKLSGLLDMIKAGGGSWNMLLKNGNNNPVQFYATPETDGSPLLPELKSASLASEFSRVNDFISAVQENPYAVGFCRMVDLPKNPEQFISGNIRLLPFDKNENGRIDYFESIYKDFQSFSRGVWIGKYPKELVSNVYLVSALSPENTHMTDFAGWALTQGQQYFEPEGFSELAQNERQSKLAKLHPAEIVIEPESGNWAVQKIILIIFLIFLSAGVITSLTSIFRPRAASVSTIPEIKQPGIIHEKSLTLPEGLYFDKTHTWVYLEKNGSVKMGIADFLPLITGPLTRVSMKAPGEKVKKNEPVVTIAHEGKQINLFAPVSGTIKEINEELVTDPSLINREPYSEGWVYLLEPSNWLREIQFFKMAQDYREWLKKEISRLKDFLAKTANSGQPEFAPVYQEGGELKAHILQNQTPEIWEKFQKEFIEISKL